MNSVIGPEGSRPAPKHFVNGRNRIILSLLFIAVLIATVSFTVNASIIVCRQGGWSQGITLLPNNTKSTS